VVWRAVERTLAAEVFQARYQCGRRNAWETRSVDPDAPRVRFLGDDTLVDPATDAMAEDAARRAVTPVVSRAWQALLQAGWQPQQADALLGLALEQPAMPRAGARAFEGWRTLAAELDVPAWQVRRGLAVLLGEPDTPGLLAMMLHQGPDVVDGIPARRALQATRSRWASSGKSRRLLLRDEPRGADLHLAC
jgi:hypothetical protein